MKKIRKNYAERLTAMDVVLVIVLGLLALLAIFPFYQVVLLSFSDSVSYASHPLYLLPYALDVTGYKAIFRDMAFWRSVGVSVFVTVVGTGINMFLSVMGGYVLSKRRLVGRRLFMNLIVFTMLFGGGLIPTYLVGRGLGLVNSIWAMILPNAISTYNMIIMKNYFMSIPESLMEAARIDGANEFKILVKIVLPISVPFLATFILFYAVARWNEWYNANLYINQSSLFPLQIYLRNVLINMSSNLSDIAKQFAARDMKVNSTAMQMAAIVVTSVPILCVYPFVQKHFVKGVLIGSVKE